MKTLIGSVLFCVSLNVNAVTMYVGSNLTFLDGNGNVFGGTNDVRWSFDETFINTVSDGTAFNGDIISNNPFFGFAWDAHHVRVFGEGAYTFDSTCTSSQISLGVSNCNNAMMAGQTDQYTTINVGPGQLGLHMLWDWNTTNDIDIAIVWDKDSIWSDPDGQTSPVNNLFTGPIGDAPDPLMTWQLVSTDADSDGFNGIRMVDGPFQGFSANYNFHVVPVPATVWLFGSGLLGLIGIARIKKA